MRWAGSVEIRPAEKFEYNRTIKSPRTQKKGKTTFQVGGLGEET